ncbi:MAG: metal-sensing transcriptional repressor [Pelagimonas sp.]|jgi:DNA-binding FrmR family transcriptional regulator|nr:metal-sensing transcriptional repressor [Pelagimonas sp.]
MSTSHPHSSHPKIVSRLKRADGHLRAVIVMVEAGRPCVELAQQLQAVESAIRNAKQTLIHDHIDHCLSAQSPSDPDALKSITRYL